MWLIGDQMLSRWETEVFEGRFHLPKTAPPTFAARGDRLIFETGPRILEGDTDMQSKI